MSANPTLLQKRIGEQITMHGSLRASARALRCDVGYLSRLQSGEKTSPGTQLLRRLGIKKVTTYVSDGGEKKMTTEAMRAAFEEWWEELRKGETP